jgi:hypothetical protein
MFYVSRYRLQNLHLKNLPLEAEAELRFHMEQTHIYNFFHLSPYSVRQTINLHVRSITVLNFHFHGFKTLQRYMYGLTLKLRLFTDLYLNLKKFYKNLQIYLKIYQHTKLHILNYNNPTIILVARYLRASLTVTNTHVSGQPAEVRGKGKR